MDSFLGYSIFLVLFILFSGFLYLLIKRNVFSNSNTSDNVHEKFLSKENITNLDRLKEENKVLNKELKFLEEKNKRLKLKIIQMKESIKNLEEQKKQLENSENKLKELRVQKDETLAMVAHDLKNPASTIKNFVELLESYDLSAQEQHDVFSGLIETSLRLVKLADEFTNVIAEEFVPFNLHKSKRDLKKIVESMVNVNKVIAQKKNIEIRLFNTDSELQIEMDEEKIKEVLDNFIGNAIKFCPEKSKIDVITKFENNKAIVEVQDNGFGLNEDEIDRAFEKGSKLSNKPTGNETSSGLGLWISKRIIEEHKGRVFLKSKKGFGSTFTFSLPIN